MIDLGPSPPSERFHRNGVGGQMMFAPIKVASTGNGDTLGHGVEGDVDNDRWPL